MQSIKEATLNAISLKNQQSPVVCIYNVHCIMYSVHFKYIVQYLSVDLIFSGGLMRASRSFLSLTARASGRDRMCTNQ